MSKKDINIQKATPTELYAKKAPYSSLSNDVVASIRNPDALAIWVYLQTRSGDWKVIASYLQTHFSIGRDRYRKAMSDLAALGLISHELQRDPENGQVMGKRIIVHYEPNIQISAPSAPETPKVQVSHHSADPHSGKTTPYLIKDSLTQLSDKEPMADKSAGCEEGKVDSEALFSGFWKLYPRKVSKEEARKAWTKLKLTQGLYGAIVEALAVQVTTEDWKKEKGKFIPHPATWINGKRWEDEVQPESSTQSSHHNGFANRNYEAGLTAREGGGYAF